MKKAVMAVIISAFAFALRATPEAPKNLSLVYNNLIITAVWNAVTATSTSYYNLYRATYQGFGYSDATFIVSVTPTATALQYSAQDTIANSGTAYYYAVNDVDSSGNTSALSVEIPSAPYPPAGLSTTDFNTKVFLTWTGDYDPQVTGYNIYRSSTAPDSGFGNIATVYGGNDFMDTGLTNYITYYYKMTAISSSEGPYSLTMTAVSFVPPGAPYNVSSTAASYTPFNAGVYSGSSGSAVSLGWATAGLEGTYPVSGFNVFRNPDYGPDTPEYAAPTMYTATFHDPYLAPGNTYNYALETVDVNGNTSIPYYLTILGVPAPPASLAYTPLPEGTNLTWSPSSPSVTGYKVYKSDGTVISTVAQVTTTAYTDASISNITTYYSVTAINASGESVYPGWITVTGSSIASPSAPTGLTATSTSPAGVKLAWAANDAHDQVTLYVVYRASYAYFDVSSIAYASSTTTSYTDAAVASGKLFYYALQASNTAGLSPFSSYLGVTVMPSAPSGLVAAYGNTSNSVSLSWSPNTSIENVTQYDIYRATSQISMVTSTAFVDTSPIPGIVNYYRVAGVNNVEGAYSAVTITPFATPDAPTGVNVSPGNTYAALNWSASPGYENVTEYNIYRSINGTNFTLDSSNTLTSYSDTGLTNGTGYLYKVSAVNIYGEGPQSQFVSVTPTAGVRPIIPQGVTLASNGDGHLDLSWQAYLPQDGVSGYNIYRTTYPGADGSFYLFTQTQGNTFSDSIMNTASADSVSNTTVYYYAVSAYNGLSSPASAEVSGEPTTLPFPPINVSLVNVADEIVMSWNPPPQHYTNETVSKYRIWRATLQSSAAYQFVSQTANTNYIDSGINTLVAAYYYKIITIDDIGNSDTTQATYTVIVMGLAPPPAVILAKPGNFKVTLFWQLVTAQSYDIYRSTIQGVYGPPILQTGIGSTKQWVDTNVTTLNTYYYTVAAVNSSGEGLKSNEVSALPYVAASVPAVGSQGLSYTILSKTDVQISWVTATAGTYPIVLYNIYRSQNGGATYSYLNSVTPTAGALRLQFIDTTTKWGMDYDYLIKVVDLNGNEDAEYEVLVVDLPQPANRLRVYANLIHLNLGETLRMRYQLINEGQFKVKVYTLSGSFVKLLVQGNTSGTVSSDLPYESPDFYWDCKNDSGQQVASGVYLLTLEIKGQRYVSKVAVIK